MALAWILLGKFTQPPSWPEREASLHSHPSWIRPLGISISIIFATSNLDASTLCPCPATHN